MLDRNAVGSDVPQKTGHLGRGRILALLLGVLVCQTAVSVAFGSDLGEREAIMWQYEEWSVENASWSGNPFDVIATVAFTHNVTGEKRVTQMFYSGKKTWTFRFTGTRIGTWQFSTISDDPELNGHTGNVTVKINLNPNIKGFLTHKGNRFAIRAGNDGHLEAYRFNVYMNGNKVNGSIGKFPGETEKIQAYLDDAEQYGFDTIFFYVANNWFRYGALSYKEHNSVNPDRKTFRILENVIATAHRRGCRVHLWAWGDESRKWTPIGVGGINGTADRRLQRYIAARLGPLPGWTMGYGFDLHEWTKGSQLDAWARYLHEHMGWDHLLCARGHKLRGSGNNIDSYDGFGRKVQLATTQHGPRDCQEVVNDLDSDPTRPHFYEERHTYRRQGFNLDKDGTRRLLWWQAMAGGMGGFYGFYPKSPHPYPAPEQLRCVRDFWQGRFFMNMVRENKLADGYCLRTPDSRNFVFYKENTEMIRVDLSRMPGPQSAVAVDTTQPYREIAVGMLKPSNQTIELPAVSDWAVAIGAF